MVRCTVNVADVLLWMPACAGMTVQVRIKLLVASELPLQEG